jgi:urea carboxylase
MKYMLIGQANKCNTCWHGLQVRIIRTAKELGIKTVSVYTRADVASLHVSTADVAKLLPGPDASAYTDGDAIIKIAKEENAQAIIPGYGFLSENADFAREVGKAGLVWVGPSPEAIEVGMSQHSIPSLPCHDRLLIPHF